MRIRNWELKSNIRIIIESLLFLIIRSSIFDSFFFRVDLKYWTRSKDRESTLDDNFENFRFPGFSGRLQKAKSKKETDRIVSYIYFP